ncbi:hypothetical protein SAMN05216328_12540 [Ensifer sp. YR511]|nr:hypothetical protein SAMN05216328_12540 [Ensifer sp. YR511]
MIYRWHGLLIYWNKAECMMTISSEHLWRRSDFDSVHLNC